MKLATFLSLALVLLGLGICQDLQAQTSLARYELQFVPVSNSGTSLDVAVQIRSAGAGFQLFNANLIFTYTPVSNFGKPVLLKRFGNFDNTVSTSYREMTMTYPAAGVLSLNIAHNEAPYTKVSTSWMDVGVVRLPITNTAGGYALTWKTSNATSPTASAMTTLVYQYTGETTRPGIVAGGRSTDLKGSLGSLDLLAFTARLSGSQVLLNWATSADSKIGSFEVERSAQMTAWTKIGTVDGSDGANTYSYTDNSIATTAAAYYRLKMLDASGQFKYSPIAKVQRNSTISAPQLLASYPNPFNPNVTVHFTVPSDQVVTVAVFDASGKEITRLYDNELLQAGDYSKVFNGSDLASGKYLLRMVAGDYIATENLILNK